MKLKQSRKKAKDIIETIDAKKSSGSKITPIFEEINSAKDIKSVHITRK